MSAKIFTSEVTMNGNKLRLKALELLKERPPTQSLSMISNHTKIPIGWLKYFAREGDKNDAGSDRIVILYEYLSRKELKI